MKSSNDFSPINFEEVALPSNVSSLKMQFDAVNISASFFVN